jgi:hypothetical protein
MDAPAGRLSGLAPSWRLLVTGFVLVIGSGYLMGALNAALAVGLTPAAVADHYRDQTLTRAEAATLAKQGYVEEEFSFDQPAPAAHDHMAGMAGMEGMPGMEGAAGPPPAPGHGVSITRQQLAQLSHVHLLGFSFILLTVGALACLTTLPEALKVAVVVLLALCLGADIGGLWLVRFVSEGYGWVTAASGATVGVCLLVTSLRVLWEVWFRSPEEIVR